MASHPPQSLRYCYINTCHHIARLIDSGDSCHIHLWPWCHPVSNMCLGSQCKPKLSYLSILFNLFMIPLCILIQKCSFIFYMYFTCFSNQIAVNSLQISLSAHAHYCTCWEREPHTSLLHRPQIGVIIADSMKTSWYWYLYVQTLYFYFI